MSLLALLTKTQADTTPPPTSSIDPATLTDFGVVGAVTRYSRGATMLTEDRTFQAPLTLNAPAQEIHLLYSSAPGGAVATIAAAVEHGGNVYSATFAGQPRATISGTGGTQWATGVVTLPAPLPAGTEIRVRTFGTSGSALMTGMAAQGGPIQSSAGDLTTPGSAEITPNPKALASRITPVAVLGKTTPGVISVAGLGDSIMEGGSDEQYENNSGGPPGGGFFTRATRAAGVPATCYGIWADNFPADPATDRRFGALSEHTHAVCEYGTNALWGVVVNGGGDWKALGRDAVRFWTKVSAQGVKVAQTTLTPKVISTDGYVTIEGQTPSGNAKGEEPIRLAYNAWIRAGAPIVNDAPVDPGTPGALVAGQAGHPLVGTIDTNAAVMVKNSRGEEVFDVDPGGVKLTVDEAHPAPAGHARMAVPVRDWITAQKAKITTP